MTLGPGSRIGWVGAGVMGAAMAGHLIDAGYRLRVHTRTRAKAEGLLARGAEWAGSAGAAALDVAAVVTMVGYPSDVEEVYLARDGIVAEARPGTLLVDMTTSSPKLATRIAEAGAARGLRCLDAPVSGGDIGARDAALSIMAGGSTDDFEAALPLFGEMGRAAVLQGGPGAGQHTKMCNQIAIASTMMGVCEALVYAERADLDPARVLESIGSGAAGSWTLANLAPRMLAGDFAPGFYVKHFVKDMRIALESAQEMGLETPGLSAALSLYERLAEAGGAELGTQALLRVYREAL